MAVEVLPVAFFSEVDAPRLAGFTILSFLEDSGEFPPGPGGISIFSLALSGPNISVLEVETVPFDSFFNLIAAIESAIFNLSI